MAGHSKWANIKHRKSAQDAKRGVLFSKLVKSIEAAAKEGADPNTNLKLKLAIEKARSFNLPSANLERAIHKGAGLGEERSKLTEVLYEGFGPAGVGILVEALTDNKNRTSNEIKRIFAEVGGSLASAGSVLWQFVQRGLITLRGGEDEVLKAIDAGAKEVERENDLVSVYTDPGRLNAVKSGLLAAGVAVETASLAWISKVKVKIEEEAAARQILRLLNALDEHDDVEAVSSNFEMDESLLAKFS